MDYDKLHKDTITRLHQMVNSGKITVETACSICADFVPESEDGRIRKDMIETIKKEAHDFPSSVIAEKSNSWIAWLEKQGGKDEEILILKDQIESLHAAIKAIKETHRIELEKRGEQNLANSCKTCKDEQKPVEHLELKAGHWYICHRAYCCRADDLTVKEGERFMCEKDGVVKGFVIKNPENYFKEVNASAPLKDEYNLLWSEEDESNRIIIEGELLSSQRNANPYEHATYDKLISWVNSIKDRVQPQQEWSEEDEYVYNEILKRVADKKLYEHDLEYIYNWLKSLRPQSTWKPSDEQMKALKEAVDEHFDIDGGALWHLYEQLKKHYL